MMSEGGLFTDKNGADDKSNRLNSSTMIVEHQRFEVRLLFSNSVLRLFFIYLLLLLLK